MSFIMILGIIVAALFAATYFTRRRFGVLGLALTAGFLLSGLWTAEVTPLIKQAGVELLSPPLASVVAGTLVLLPAVVLLFSGPTYSKHAPRVIGSVAFALLAAALLLPSLYNGLVLDTNGKQIYDLINQNRNIIITVAVVYALFDILTIKSPKKDKDKE